MRLLLDTHVMVWWFAGGERLPAEARRLVADPSNEVFVSAASLWEVAIKAALGKIRADASELAEAIEPGGFRELPVSGRHAAAVATLPSHHRDPFDRMLVAQSLVEPMHLLTVDRALSAYGPSVLVAGSGSR